MANQAKATNLTFINITVMVDEGLPTERQVPIRWAVSLSDATTGEADLALDLQTDSVKESQVSIRIDSIRANMPAASASGRTKEETLALLAKARGTVAAPAADVAPAVDPDDIPF